MDPMQVQAMLKAIIKMQVFQIMHQLILNFHQEDLLILKLKIII
jgi:hypothetical protein